MPKIKNNDKNSQRDTIFFLLGKSDGDVNYQHVSSESDG